MASQSIIRATFCAHSCAEQTSPRVGVERSQIDPECGGESMPRLSQLSFKFGERKLLLRDGFVQRLSACQPDGRLASV